MVDGNLINFIISLWLHESIYGSFHGYAVHYWDLKYYAITTDDRYVNSIQNIHHILLRLKI